MEQKILESENGCDGNLCEEQQRQKQHDKKSDANESQHPDLICSDLVTLAVRPKPPSKTDHAAELRTANDNTSRSNCETKVTPPTEYEETGEINQSRRAKSRREQSTTLGKRKRSSSPKLELFNPREGEPNAWQLGESADEFVERLLPSSASSSDLVSIWAENPHRNPRNKSPYPREDYFTTCGMQLLKQSSDDRRKILESSASLPKGILEKRLRMEGKSLQERIIKLARDTYVHAGKWILHVKPEDIDRVWKQVVVGVIGNRLGCSCETVTNVGDYKRIVHVYTKDFRDAKDVLRVLLELERMNLVSADERIYYQPDAYTYLDLRYRRAHAYALQPALYYSHIMLATKEASESDLIT